jgi:hypothetical protein
LGIGVSLLSHLPSYSGSYSASYPEGNSDDYAAGCTERNLESYLGRCLVRYWTDYLDENLTSYWTCGWDSNPVERSSDCPGNRRGSSLESSLPSNGANNLLGYSESNPAGSSTGNRDSRWATPAAMPPNGLPGNHDLADGLRLSLCFPDKVDPRRQPAHIIRAGP